MYAFVAKGADVCFHSSWQVCHARLRLRLIRRCCFCLCLHMQLFRRCRKRLRLFDCSRHLCLHLQLLNRCRSRLWLFRCSCCLILRPCLFQHCCLCLCLRLRLFRCFCHDPRVCLRMQPLGRCLLRMARALALVQQRQQLSRHLQCTFDNKTGCWNRHAGVSQ